MLHYRKNPTEVKKAYPFAAVAKMEGVPFCYFSFSSIDIKARKISGWIYENGEWIQKSMEVPTVIINSCNPKNEQQKEILKGLKHLAVFTSYPVGNKLKVYKKLLKGKKFASYMIPSHPINSSADVISFLNKQTKAVVKPLSGNHGNKVFFIEKLEDRFNLIDGPNVITMKLVQLENFINQQILAQKFLLQSFIDCKTQSGLTYDFRLHVQKNGSGKWEVTLIYPRISGNSKLISNINNGGYRGELVPFLQDEFGEKANKIKTFLEQFALSFSTHFDTLYEHSFDELGIDVGMDQFQRLWVFEVNWRPGSKNREFEVAKRLIPYCRYLAYHSPR